MYYQQELNKIRICRLILSHKIKLGGNKQGRIYGALSCTSGKRMKTTNRVFFADEEEATTKGYRPCGHCMREQYNVWRSSR